MPRVDSTSWVNAGGVLAALLVLAGCMLTTPERHTQLEDTLRTYDAAIRWGHYGTAQAFVKRGEGQNADLRPVGSEIRVTGYEVVREAILNQEQADFTQRLVQIRYYNTEYAREKTLMDPQQWVFDEQAKRWLITSGLPRFD